MDSGGQRRCPARARVRRVADRALLPPSARGSLGRAPTGLANDMVNQRADHRRRRPGLRPAGLLVRPHSRARRLRRRHRPRQGRPLGLCVSWNRPVGHGPDRPAGRPVRFLHRFDAPPYDPTAQGPLISPTPYYYTLGQIFVTKAAHRSPARRPRRQDGRCGLRARSVRLVGRTPRPS